MTQAPGPVVTPTRSGAPSNIYTVLMLVSLLILVCGVGFIWYRSSQLYGDNPFVAPEIKTTTPGQR